MSKITYVPKRFGARSTAIITKAEEICEEYARQGFTLTLRQLYYQFVARDIIPNQQSEYKRLGEIINDARLAGLIDWTHMEDRTRNLQSLSVWENPQSILAAVAEQYREDLWKDQRAYLEVWIEKDALLGVIEPVCQRNRVPYFSCRGYVSQSEMWAAGMRLNAKDRFDKECMILHLGDHDPSGVQMTEDIRGRLLMFARRHGCSAPEVRRIALTMDQVQQYDPPPNPAKLTDSRGQAYVDEYGVDSWELDALEPTVLDALIQEHIDGMRDPDVWDTSQEQEETHKAELASLSEHWDEVEDWLKDRWMDS